MHFPEPKWSLPLAEATLSSFGPCVYAWRRKKRYLYIGYSRKGMAAISQHKVIGTVEPLQKGDRIDFWPFPKSAARAQGLALRMNNYLRPLYSYIMQRPEEGKLSRVRCVSCGTMFMQKRWWQKFCPSC